MLRRLFPFVGLTVAPAVGLTEAATVSRPNIHFALADGWSYGHAGVLGCRWVGTPAIDRRAQQRTPCNHACTPTAIPFYWSDTSTAAPEVLSDLARVINRSERPFVSSESGKMPAQGLVPVPRLVSALYGIKDHGLKKDTGGTCARAVQNEALPVHDYRPV